MIFPVLFVVLGAAAFFLVHHWEHVRLLRWRAVMDSCGLIDIAASDALFGWIPATRNRNSRQGTFARPMVS